MKSDKVVKEVVELYNQRSEKGISKYGTTLEENNIDDFLQHALEEAMDFSLYIKKLQIILRERGFKRVEDAIDNISKQTSK